MSKHDKIWFVVADGANARVLCRSADGFADVTSMASIDAHHRTSDLGSERPGRSVESSGSARHAIEPHSDPQERAKLDFAHEVAAAVNDAAERGDFTALVLVGLPKTVHAIKEKLDHAAASRLVAEHPHDLVKLPETALRDRLGALDIRLR